MDSKDLCLRLLGAESEAQVQAIVEVTKEMANPKNWRPLDRRETNFNVTSNQAATGGKALTELMTNMVDAVLMKHAYLKKIDPKGPQAPKTMYEAVDKLVKNLRGGRLVNADDQNWLREFAQKNLVIGITGAKTKKEGLPCYTFVDNGEGQNPGEFERTFLSLSEGNKKDVHFVQGKYNMGSSGVLRYCGRRWFKLIVSRRYDGKGEWGWTLMRRRPGGGMPVAEYFMPNGNIPSFDGDHMFPFTTATGKRYDGVTIRTGTIIKLYDYQVGTQFLSFKGAREALNENLVETILPFRLLDFRQLPKTAEAREKAAKRGGERAEGIDPRPFYGMEYLLLRSHKGEGSEDEDDAAGTEKLAVATIGDPELGEISVSAIPLKRQLPTWLRGSKYRVFHAVNGQVQFKESRGFLAQTCGLPALKDRAVIIVDASNLTFEAHNDIWKGDREHVSNTTVGERYLDEIATAIKESKVLKDLQEKIAREEMEMAAQSERNDLFQKLVDSDRNLAGLLSSRDPTIRLPSSGGEGGGDSGKGAFEGKYSPTFLRIEEKVKANGLEIPFNRTRPVAARTDAENGYLQRQVNKGRLLIDDGIRAKFGIRAHLYDGRLTVYLDPVEDLVAIGDVFTFKIGLQDDAMPFPVEDEITVRIVEEEAEAKKTNGKSQPKKAGESDGQKGAGQDAPTHGLPHFRLLTEDGRDVGGQPTEKWPDGFTKFDGGYVESLGKDEAIYKVNYDNVYHLSYRKQQRGEIARDVVSEKYILGMRILMLGYAHAFKQMAETVDGVAEFEDDFKRMAARGAASTVLALAENLPKIVDSSTVGQDVE